MPLVYPPNFEGVRLTYEYVGAYLMINESDFDVPTEATPLTVVTGNLTEVDVGPETCFFWMYEDLAYDQLRVRGFVNTSVVDSITVRKNNSFRTYYMAYVGTMRSGDEVFIKFRCRITLNGVFSEPIIMRVYLELGPTYDLNRVSLNNVPESAILNYSQNDNN